MKIGKRVTVTFAADKAQIDALRRHARSLEDGESMQELLRDAVDEYLSRHTRERPPRKVLAGGLRQRAGAGGTPPRIMLHLRSFERLKLLQLQARTLRGTHRTVGRVIRAAVDEYLAAHEGDRREFLRRQAEELARPGSDTAKPARRRR